MGDSDGVFGGNGSVEWRVNSRRSRKASVKVRRKGSNIPVVDGDPNDHWEVTGTTEVATVDAPQVSGPTFAAGPKPNPPFFTITIELPEAGSPERTDLLDAFKRAVTPANGAARVEFYLPIVGSHRRQIVLEWPD
jgi:hypothetical protein